MKKSLSIAGQIRAIKDCIKGTELTFKYRLESISSDAKGAEKIQKWVDKHRRKIELLEAAIKNLESIQ